MSDFKHCTIKKAFERTGIPINTINDNIAKGKFTEEREYRRVGRSVFIIIEGLDQWIENGGAQELESPRKAASRSGSGTKERTVVNALSLSPRPPT